MGDTLSAPVHDPVEEGAYPDRPLSEAQAGVATVIPHDEESRASNVYVDHVVDPESGESQFVPNERCAEEGFLVPPHGDYVEDTETLYPGYRPPIYDEPVTSGGIPVADLAKGYESWNKADLEAELDRRDIGFEENSTKKQLIADLKQDDKDQAE